MKKFAVLAMAAVSFLLTLDSSEAQVLRRFRNNIREAINPLAIPQQIQPLNSVLPQGRVLPRVLPQRFIQQPQVRVEPRVSPQPQFVQPQVQVQQRVSPQFVQPQVQVQQRVSPQTVQPQVRIQRPAPQRVTSGPQQLTPYSRLTPQQRVSVPQPQLASRPVIRTPTPVGNSSVQSGGSSTIRVVTYLDPSSGRTFQRRYLLPGNSPTGITRATQGQIVTGRRSIFTEPTTVNAPTRQSLVPPFQFAPQIARQPVSVSPSLSPILAGPALAAPISVAQPIAASIDNSLNALQFEAASAGLQTASVEVESTSTGIIPDLSGITVDPEPVDSTFADLAPNNSTGVDGPALGESTFVDLAPNDSTGVDSPALGESTFADLAPAGSTVVESANDDGATVSIETAPVDDALGDAPALEDQDLFFDDDFADETVEVSAGETAEESDDYSVLEEVEEE